MMTDPKIDNPISEMCNFGIKGFYQYSLPGYKTTGSKILEKNLVCVEEALKKRLVFQRLWPSMFLGIVNDALEDYIDLNRHMKLSMQSLLKKCKSLDESDSND